MPQTTITFRTDSRTKENFDDFCSEVGMNASVAFNMFMKATLNSGELPFRISRAKTAIDDTRFFSGANLEHLMRSKAQAEAGHITEHDLIRPDGNA